MAASSVGFGKVQIKPPSFTHIFVTDGHFGDIYLRFAWQAWHLWHWAGPGGVLGLGLVGGLRSSPQSSRPHEE